MNRRIRAYAFAVGGAFWLAFLVVCVRNPGSLPSLATLAPLLGLAIAGEEVVVRKRQRWGGSVFSFSAPAHVAAVLLIGPLGAALVAASAVVIVDGLRQESRRYVLLNSSMFGGAAWIAGLVFHVCGGSTRVIEGWTLPALIALIVARYLVTSVVFAGGTALVVDAPFGVLVKETVAGGTVAAIGEGSLGVLV